MCFLPVSGIPELSLRTLLVLGALLAFSHIGYADENQLDSPGQSITLESQQSYEGTCSKLVIAGDDYTSACGTSLVVLTMSNGSVSITLQRGDQFLGLYGAQAHRHYYNIHGAMVSETDALPLQGYCEMIIAMNGSSALICQMTDETAAPWEIRFAERR
ncbi:hypothetical protein [Cellvibrio japonicus]|uniref:Uncharacterized protein n=1 Tax=Cellvibrio japonicus (strain Ueda107) TaxID=498211 RepID=B3PFL0_CELJU|nr:hypothetical protein [Cellvibrio japonicus]ACE86018.1 hypothetical protein CJA_0126 [Cellvibrio japonicus Ueda107]QEI10874.1 hypothetical protein FY117_00605 [Cellvibrio japonicus]QEI14450.1 hypothetical protein FY116_00605 [Cellvibrio japonicus]QEI18028.1 hypothetical protein FY115_00605 [Cellvibrio japonicus]